MRALVIHVPGDPRRERNVQRLCRDLRAAGLRPEVVPGVRPDDAGPLRSRGEWGCYQSHLAAVRILVADGEPGLVLEDDVVLEVAPAQLAALLASAEQHDLLHLGYSFNTVFRAWDEALLARPLLRTKGVLYGGMCYAVRPAGLAPHLDELAQMPFEDPLRGGGVGWDGAVCELGWRHPSLVRLAPPRSLFRELPGLSSGLRPRSRVQRVRELAGWSARRALRRLRPAGRRAPAVPAAAPAALVPPQAAAAPAVLPVP